MLDLTFYDDAMNVAFPKGLSWMVPSKSRLYRYFDKKFSVRGKKILWRPNIEAANGSTDWDDAQTYAAGPIPLEAQFSFDKDYVHVVLDNELDDASSGDGASEPAEVALTKAAIKEHALSVKGKIINNGGGARAQILSGSGTATVTLVNVETAALFLPKMWVVASDDDGTVTPAAGLRGAGAATQVTAPRVRLGQLTTETGANWNVVIPGLQDGDYLFRRGDYGAGVIGSTAFRGLGNWFPRTAPSPGDNHGGIDRSDSPDKLAGLNVTDLPSNILEALFELRCAMEPNVDEDEDGTKVMHCVMSAKNTKKLLSAIQTQGQYSMGGGTATAGAMDFVIQTPYGKVNCISETGFPQDELLMGDLGAFEMHFREPDAPQWFKKDGKIWRHTGSQGDSISAWLGSKCATRCINPSVFARGIFA